jgi:hypothetical protein
MNDNSYPSTSIITSMSTTNSPTMTNRKIKG